MTTDSERREVARRLRELRSGWSSGECYYTIINALGLPDTSREDGGAALYARLADLIEPSCDRDAERTCRVESSYPAWGKDEYEIKLSCGDSFPWWEGCPPDFCPCCGAKVVCVTEVKVDGERLEELVHDAAVEVTGIDREALLALADEMDEVAQRRRSMGYEGFAIGDEDRARRIREALGVES